MATDSNEAKKETVRVTVPAQQNPVASPSAPPRDTVRIHLPSRPPVNPPPTPPDRPSPVRAATAAMPALPDPPPKPAVQMKKTQPLIDSPAMETPTASITMTSPREPQVWIDQVPMRLCWALVAVSAAILILQIWNYLS